MKITGVRTFLVDAYRNNLVFVKVETDEGISGVGEATLEFRERTVATAIDELGHYLIGKDPREIELHYQTIYRDSYWRIGPVLMSALSGIEMCLWDISAKELGVPVYRLLGGRMRDRIRCYANAWFSGARTPAEFATKAKAAVAGGFTALKWDPFGSAYRTMSSAELEAALATVAAVREAVGPGIDLLIEGHGRFDVRTACVVAGELASCKPMFFEEPVPPDELDALADVKRRSPVPIAAGERLMTKHQFKDLLEKRAADVIQPDPSHAGGILECTKIAAMAEARHIEFAPHNPMGPVANAVVLQLAACTPNFTILECMANDVPWRGDLTTESIRFVDGCFEIPDRPGLGIELNEAAFADHPYSPRQLRHYRGDLTDIRPPDAVEYFKRGTNG